MNAVYSFNSKSFLFEDKLAVNYTNFFFSWGLSVSLAKKHFTKVILVTDDKGKELLYDILKLPFDEVMLNFNTSPNVNKNLFLYPKIYAMDLQTEPFVYIEPDVFLFNQINSNAGIILQSYEGFSQGEYSELFAQYISDLETSGFADEIFINREISLNYGFNTGIVGGTDIQFIKYYCGKAKDLIDFINQNYPDIKLDLYLLYERWLMALCLSVQNKTPELYLQNRVDSVNKGYTHLQQQKGSNIITHLVKNKLEMLFPDIFKSIIDALHNNKLTNIATNSWS